MNGTSRPRTRTYKRILAEVAEGKSNNQIGESFGVNGDTIRKDLTEVYRILGCKSKDRVQGKRCEAVAIAFRKGWIE